MVSGVLVPITGLLGVVVVVTGWLSVLRTVFTPRRTSSRIARGSVRAVVAVVFPLARHLPHQLRERVLDTCTPVSVFLMAWCWLGLQVVGFGLLAVSTGATPPRFTEVVRFFMLEGVGAAAGLVLPAWVSCVMVLSVFMVHLLRLTDSFRRRELSVAGLMATAETPLDAESLLADYLRTGSREQLDGMFAQWSAWLADIRATHVSYPSLLYYRPASQFVWLRAAVVVLDAAALVQAVAPNWAPPHTRALLHTGTCCLHESAIRLGLHVPKSVVSLHGREEHAFTDSVRGAVSAGLPPERTGQDAWWAFQAARTRYAPHISAISARLMYDFELPAPPVEPVPDVRKKVPSA
ncbi:hypothetical protein FHS29_000911 [Saccharothrix tamanrassetensis]|uniref:Uncharacterized protein n=1 Tax=Saccharothrix tamanrassetensis TaxID=1051531 RepID=A0A841CAV8_9PSEU|nr:hypothetical protein [Saccharothrix tamanrassetensis]MBB5954341.1 hypothetical protein [Saccharothrix tamanrassetensis]